MVFFPHIFHASVAVEYSNVQYTLYTALYNPKTAQTILMSLRDLEVRNLAMAKFSRILNLNHCHYHYPPLLLLPPPPLPSSLVLPRVQRKSHSHHGLCY